MTSKITANCPSMSDPCPREDVPSSSQTKANAMEVLRPGDSLTKAAGPCLGQSALAKANPLFLLQTQRARIETNPPMQKVNQNPNTEKQKWSKDNICQQSPTTTLCLSSVLSVQYNNSLQQGLALFGLMYRTEACRLLFPLGVLAHCWNINGVLFSPWCSF